MLRYAHDCNKNLNVNLNKNSPKTSPKALPNDLQNGQFGSLKRSLGPSGHQDLKFDPNLTFQGLLKVTLLEALGAPSGLISTKMCKNWCPKTVHETGNRIERIWGPPKPQKLVLYYSKTHILTNAPGTLKVHKMNPKWTPEEHQRPPKTSRRPPKELKKYHRKFCLKKHMFRNLVSTMNGKRVQAWDGKTIL